MNKVFIAASLDGFIADQKGSVDFLNSYPDIPGEDIGCNCKFLVFLNHFGFWCGMAFTLPLHFQTIDLQV
jgi:hypothetical protein